MIGTRKPAKTCLSSVLVAAEGNGCDDEAVRLACELLSSQKGSLYVVYVIEVDRGLPVDAEIVSATAKGEEILKQMEKVAKSYKCETRAELLQSRRTGLAVVREAVEKGVDAIVLGIPYKQVYGSFSMGETAPYVLKNAPCRVILWRDPAPETTSPNTQRP